MSFLQERKRRILLDMDNVLVDFETEFSNRFGTCKADFEQGVYQKGNDEFWALFDSNSTNFFRDAPAFSGTRTFVEEIFVLADNFGYDVEALTAIPRKSLSPNAHREKNEWMMAQRFSRPIKVNIGPYAPDKHKHARPGDILCDDSRMNIEQWIATGNVGILHTSFEDSLAEIKIALAISDCRAIKFYKT